MKIAYHTYAFGGRSWMPSWTLEEAMRLTAEIGFDGIELAAWRPHAWPHDLDATRRQEINRLARQYGLAYSAVCMVQVNHNIASPLDAERRGSLVYIQECINLAADLECPTVVVGGGWSVQPHQRQEAWEMAAEILKKAAWHAQKRGITLALENINRQRADVVVSTNNMLEMIREIGSPSIRPMLDFYHLHLEGEDPLQAIRCLGKDLAYVHFLDARLANRSRQVLGKGELALDTILSTLVEIGYNGWLCAEIWGDDPIDIGKQTIQHYRNLRELVSSMTSSGAGARS
jgi:sugar phosphate isomerase/epimerase